jgi:hypothetical protein
MERYFKAEVQGRIRAHRLGMAPGHELNNISEVWYIPSRQNIVQQGAALRSAGTGPYQEYRLAQAPGRIRNTAWAWHRAMN